MLPTCVGVEMLPTKFAAHQEIHAYMFHFAWACWHCMENCDLWWPQGAVLLIQNVNLHQIHFTWLQAFEPISAQLLKLGKSPGHDSSAALNVKVHYQHQHQSAQLGVMLLTAGRLHAWTHWLEKIDILPHRVPYAHWKVFSLHAVSMCTHCYVQANTGLEHLVGSWASSQNRMGGVEALLETAQTVFGLAQTLNFKFYSWTLS